MRIIVPAGPATRMRHQGLDTVEVRTLLRFAAEQVGSSGLTVGLVRPRYPALFLAAIPLLLGGSPAYNKGALQYLPDD
jgi:hypothetical protein